MSQKRYEENELLLAEGKNISELQCIYTEEEIKLKIKEMYPDMDDLEVNYHADKIEYNDWLKVCNDEDEFETVIREQIEPTD